MSRLMQDGTAEPVSGDQVLRRERRQENIIFPSSVDHEQDWQSYSVDPHSTLSFAPGPEPTTMAALLTSTPPTPPTPILTREPYARQPTRWASPSRESCIISARAAPRRMASACQVLRRHTTEQLSNCFMRLWTKEGSNT